jgi:hypothetical protein
MAPRHSARVAQAAERAAGAFAALPYALFLRVLAALPADARAQAARVCRAWRAAVAERSLWRQLDLTPQSGVTCKVTDAALRALAARAGGQMDTLRLPSCAEVLLSVLAAVAAANAATLRVIAALPRPNHRSTNSWTVWRVDTCEALLRAAPSLQCLMVGMECGSAEAHRMLRNEPPFGPLRIHTLDVQFDEEAGDAELVALAADLAAHESLTDVVIMGPAPLLSAATATAVVDAALSLRLQSVTLLQCGLSPAWAPALARLLGSTALETLRLGAEDGPLLDLPTATLVAPALRASRSLTGLYLHNSALFEDAAAAAALLGALTAHPRLRQLAVTESPYPEFSVRPAAGALLGALLAADSALERLFLAGCELGDAALRPLVNALPRNARLRELDIKNNGMSDAFARERLLPAVRANRSLRKLVVVDEQEGRAPPYTGHEAVALVDARSAGAE